ncbi:MAG: cold shock domain-containing protein [Pseudomonas sp.]|nr:cold shock domain-containing protein [Pseudomonas sp.]
MDKSYDESSSAPTTGDTTLVVQHQGLVIELEAGQGRGRIETTDGRQLPFHRRDVAGGAFDGLRKGDQVRFAEELGDEGPEARKVECGEV